MQGAERKWENKRMSGRGKGAVIRGGKKKETAAVGLGVDFNLRTWKEKGREMEGGVLEPRN